MRVTAMLADHVDAGNGKLYVSGGAWNQYSVSGIPVRLPRVGIAMAIHVPWTSTNHPHKFTVHLEDQDGNVLPLGDEPPGEEGAPPEPVNELGGTFNIGRPPNLSSGDEQIIAIPITVDNLLIETPGSYSFVIKLDGTEVERLTFRVVQAQEPIGV